MNNVALKSLPRSDFVSFDELGNFALRICQIAEYERLVRACLYATGLESRIIRIILARTTGCAYWGGTGKSGQVWM